jgi:hypothetical protein
MVGVTAELAQTVKSGGPDLKFNPALSCPLWCSLRRLYVITEQKIHFVSHVKGRWGLGKWDLAQPTGIP